MKAIRYLISSVILLFLTVGISAGNMPYDYLLLDKGKGCLLYYQNAELNKTLLNSMKGISCVRFSNSSNNSVYFLEKTADTYNIFAIDTSSSEKRRVLTSTARILDFDINQEHVYFLRRDPKMGIEARELVHHNLKTGRQEILFSVTGKNEFLDNLIITDEFIIFGSKDFYNDRLLIMDKESRAMRQVDGSVSQIFRIASDNRLLVEQVKIKNGDGTSAREYDHSLGLLDIRTMVCTKLNVTYEAMAGTPILLSNTEALIPVEVHILRNQIRSFPFGFKNKDFKYVIYNFSSDASSDVITTNTDKLQILDFRIRTK